MPRPSNPPPYPIFLALHQKPILIVGGGAVASRKAKGLHVCGARVVVVSPKLSSEIVKLEGVEHVAARYAPAHMALQKWRLVFAATDDAAVNAQVQADAAAVGILCCRADEADSDFSGGATEHLGDPPSITLAVSTGGASPVLGTRICREAASALDPKLALLATLLVRWRSEVKATITDAVARRQLLSKLAGEEMESTLREHGPAAAQKLFDRWLRDSTPSPRKRRAVKHVH